MGFEKSTSSFKLNVSLSPLLPENINKKRKGALAKINKNKTKPPIKTFSFLNTTLVGPILG